MATASAIKAPKAPPIYRPNVPKVLQAKPKEVKSATPGQRLGQKNGIVQSPHSVRPMPRVIQPLLMYTYPAGTIVDKNYTEEQARQYNKVPVTYKDITVWTDERNSDDAILEASVQYNRLKREYGVIPTPQAGQLEVVDPDRDINIVFNGTLFTNRLIFKLKGWAVPGGDSAERLFVRGKLYWMEGEAQSLEDPGTLHELRAEQISAYWKTQYRSSDGYSAVYGFGADWRYNCAGYALNRREDIETTTAHEILARDYDKVGLRLGPDEKAVSDTVEGLETGVEYIIALQYHFIKLSKHSANSFVTREKNGASPVFTKTFTKEGLKAFLFGYVGGRDFHSMLYKRR